LVDHRAPEDFEGTIKASFKPEEFKELLKKIEVKKTTITEMVKRIYLNQISNNPKVQKCGNI
jgi:hypothetical protein